jgi:hypothetical protein
MNRVPAKLDLSARWRRGLVILSAVLFRISLAFPIIASITSVESLPAWVGYLDVAVAFTLVMLMIAIRAMAKNKIADQAVRASYRIYRLIANVPIVLLGVFFLFGDRIAWQILLPGLAWRAWLLIYILPAGLTVWATSKVTRVQDAIELQA